MSCQYIVVRYMPNKVRGEFINIGLIAFNDTEVASHFVCDWDRLAVFSGVKWDKPFIEDFVKVVTCNSKIGKILITPYYSKGTNKEVALKLSAMILRGSIAFSELRGSLCSPQELIDEESSSFLVPSNNH